MNRRIVVNLAVFIALVAALGVWAATNVLRLDFIERPYTVTAEFADSGGLRSGFDVTYLGVSIGTVGHVELDGTVVRAALRIDRGRGVPAQVTAAITRKSAVGEPSVALVPPAGIEAGGPVLEDGDVIGIDHTIGLLRYDELTTQIERLLATVPPGAVQTLVHELALGLDGTSDAFRQLLAASDDILETAVGGRQTIDDAIIGARRLLDELATRRGALDQSLADSTALLASVAGSGEQLAATLDGAPRLFDQFVALLAESLASLDCGLRAAQELFVLLGDEADSLARAIDLGPALGEVFRNIVQTGEHGTTLRLFIELNKGAPVPTYDERLPIPPVPASEECRSELTAGAALAGDAATAAPGAGGAAPGAAAAPTAESPPTDLGTPVPTHDIGADPPTLVDRVVDALPWLAAAALAVGVAAAMWRRRTQQQELKS